MTTIKDIAKKLDISISTVSKGLNGASDISEEMKQLVLDTALEMGYVSKTRKSNPAKQKVVILVENMDYENINQFGYEIITGFRMASSEHQCEVSIMPVDLYLQSSQTYDSLMHQNGFSGAFILGFELNDIYIEQLKDTMIPTVLFDNYLPNPNIAYIGTDNTLGTNALVKSLYKHGHRKIAILNGREQSYITKLRFESYKKAFETFHLTLYDNLIGYGNFDPSTAKDFVKDFLEQGATAFICGNDLIASGVINELHHLGKRVPEDISVAGYDDLPIAKYLAPPLTTIRQERLTLGKMAFSLLMDKMNDSPVSTILVQSNFIERESIGYVK